MKKKLFTKFIALVSMVSILVSTMGICSSASTLADNTVYKFESSFTDSTNATFSAQMLVNHYGQTFTSTNVIGTLTTQSTVPTNDYLYLYVSVYVIYKATHTEPSYGDGNFYSLTVGYAVGDKTYTSTLTQWHNINQSRVTQEITALARLSKLQGGKNNPGPAYYSTFTRKSYEHMITKTREGIIEHGYDYLD